MSACSSCKEAEPVFRAGSMSTIVYCRRRSKNKVSVDSFLDVWGRIWGCSPWF
jgi:hypothetical protein